MTSFYCSSCVKGERVMACWFVHLYRIRDRLSWLDGGQGRIGRFPIVGFGDNQSDRTIVVVLYATQISRGGGRAYEIVYNTCIKSHLSCVNPDLSNPLWPRVSSSDPTPRQDRTRPSSGAAIYYCAASLCIRLAYRSNPCQLFPRTPIDV